MAGKGSKHKINNETAAELLGDAVKKAGVQGAAILSGAVKRMAAKATTPSGKQANNKNAAIVPAAHAGKRSAKTIKSWPKAAVALAALTGVGVAAVVGAKELYDSFFGRYDRPDYTVTPGICCLQRTAGLEREELSFTSDGVKLKAYYYPCNTGNRLIVFSPGRHSGADDYLAVISYLVKNGYSVFTFDCKGTFDSDGDSTVGMIEPLVDLDHALDYIKSTPRFSACSLFLLGYSWGGYASAAVLALQSNIKACACISPYNSGYSLIAEKGEQYLGQIAAGGLPRTFLDAYQRYLFGDYTACTAVNGINSTDIPVFIAHGKNDTTIDYKQQSVTGRKSQIRTYNVTFSSYTGAQGTHTGILYSRKALAYQAEVERKLNALENEKERELTHKEKAEFYSTVNNSLYSDINKRLFDAILAMFDSVNAG